MPGLDSVAPPRPVPKKEFERRLVSLRTELVQAQFALRDSSRSLLIILNGVDGAGKGELVHRLNEWLDPRGLETHAYWRLSSEDKNRPYFWRFWKTLPSRGRIAILFGSWYTEPLTQLTARRTKKQSLQRPLDRIVSFERMLADDGVLWVKLWLHLSKKEQFTRLNDLKRHPELHWQIMPAERKSHKRFDEFIAAADQVIQHTDTPWAPWHIINATDSRSRDLQVAQHVLNAIREACLPSSMPPAPQVEVDQPAVSQSSVTLLDQIDLAAKLAPSAYRRLLPKQQAHLNQLVWQCQKKGVSTVAVFEGWDAAGKGSSIRRVTLAMDPRLFRVISVGAPTDEERAHHYLWRFWRHIPLDGMVTIYDRSWYGRVLVERVERFASPEEWTRAYREINEFEHQLAEHGTVLCKFWIHISKDQQLRRFKKREQVPYKRHKMTEEDWRNRAKWNNYKSAVNDMVARTDTEWAPWTLVPGNDKKYARTHILQTICQALEKRL